MTEITQQVDMFEENNDGQKSDQEKLMAMVDASNAVPQQELSSGEKVSGKIISVGSEFIFVDVGQKVEAVMKKEEYAGKDGAITVSEGDAIEAYVVSLKDDEIVLSKSLSSRKGTSRDIIDAMNSGIPVEGKITGVNKGGFNVRIMGKRGFCPLSQIDIKPVDQPSDYLSKTLDFVIIRVENRGRNIVLSRMPLLEGDIVTHLEELDALIQPKTVISGEITKIAEFGLFVSVGNGVEGLVHRSEVAWERIDNLSMVFSVGQKVEFIIMKIERKEPLRNSRISLSVRLVGENPWAHVTEKLIIGSTVDGTIARIAQFGAFVQLIPGIDGLIHVSEMSWGKRVNHPSEVVKVGDKVKVTILGIDEDKRSVSCTLKDVNDDPWSNIGEKYVVGSSVSGKVAAEAKYGFFVDLDENITGLLINGRIEKAKISTVKKGAEIDVTIVDVDINTRRIALSLGVVDHDMAKSKTGGNAGSDRSAKAYMKKQNTTSTRSSESEFGALLKAALKK